MASIEKRKRNDQLHGYARYRDPGGVQLVKVFGHSSPEITWRVYSYMMPSDDEAGRAAMTKTMAKLAGVAPLLPREASGAV